MKSTSIFIVPRASTTWRGNEAGWITASGWAAAGQQLWGEALVATTDGVFRPEESMLFPRDSAKGTGGGILRRLRKWIPEVAITAFKDMMLKRSKSRRWPIENAEWFLDKQVMFVWERHDLFPGPGRKLAERFGVPLVISVEAPVVWESEKWGVNRPVWGKWLEKHVEGKSLRKADLVSCVSDIVREKVIQLGVSPHKAIVSPNRVDSTMFHRGINSDVVGATYHLKDKRVIGWTGSFRSFHGLESVLAAFKKVHARYNDVVLMLVGDGQEFNQIKTKAAQMGLGSEVIFPGRQPFTAIPQFVASFYCAIVSAASAEGFHYSPLKLGEYLATGCAVIAPRAGNLPELFGDGVELLFYEAGNSSDLADQLIRLLESSALRNDLVDHAITRFEREGTWRHELLKIADRLGIRHE